MPGIGTVPVSPGVSNAMTLSARQIGFYAYKAGFRGQGLTDAIAVALAESGGRTGARNTNSDKYRSVDRGLWQINSHWHPEVSDAQAFDPAASAAAAYRISNGGKSWSQWATWPGAAAAHMGAAKLAAAATEKSGGSDPGGLGDAIGGALGNPNVNPLAGIGDAVGIARGLLGIGVKTGAWISDPHNWLRVSAVAWGAGGVVLALALIAKSGAAGDTVKGATSTVGKAAKLAVDAGAAVATDGASLAVTGGAKAAKLAKATKGAGKATAKAAAKAPAKTAKAAAA